MKVSAFRNKEPKYTADLWTFTITTDASAGSIRHYARSRTITFNAVTGSFGKLDAHFADTESDVVIMDQLQVLKGPEGFELFNFAIWQVELIAPVINVWGHREGFRARLAVVGTTQ
jgi:hypothetical protein